MKSAISASLSRRRAVEVTRISELKARNRRAADLDLEQADVGLGVEDLAVEIADLDPVAVDQPHLTDPDAGQPEGGRAAQPADPEHRDLRLAQPPLGTPTASGHRCRCR